ncbi:protein TMEPAI isoform X2 [Parasteatoda tepidariorum]|uniref:protein TMEPAI isoform X2 n=1 Tax=Parasteatoda tepidariorum TaxID=114398 RepID=UPI00077FAD89|nr:protein TMEPAI isoform X2 [Parasteatoda tepidariorum]
MVFLTQYNNYFLTLSAVQILLIVITILFAVGLITCVLSHYKMGARSWSDQRNRQLQTTRQPQQQYTTPVNTSVMYSPATVQERQRLESGAHQDQLVRLHSIQTDLALNLPHSIALPDGEEGPHCDSKLLKLHNPDQHAEITRSFIRPPPNRTVPDGNTIPPFRSNSVGQKPSLTLADVFVARSHSVSSSDAQSVKSARLKCSVPNPNITSQIWLPPAAVNLGASGISNRTYECTQNDSKYDNNEPPPPYSDVMNQWDVNTINRQQHNGI